MRVVRLLPVLVACAPLACGSGEAPTAPPSSELSLAMTMNPPAAGGIRPSTIVSAMVFLQPAPDGVVTVAGALDSAEFTVLDGRGAVLARETVTGPLPFGPNGTVSVRQALEWMPADVLGRTLQVHIVLSGASTPAILERTLTF